MKTIQITIDEDLLRKLDVEVRRERKSRSSLIRDAVSERLRSGLRKRLDEACVEAYRRRPVRKGEFPEPVPNDWDFGDRW